MRITIYPLLNGQTKTGAVVSATLGRRITADEKNVLEEHIVTYIRQNVFRTESYMLFRDYHSDGVAVCAILNINDLPQEHDRIELGYEV